MTVLPSLEDNLRLACMVASKAAPALKRQEQCETMHQEDRWVRVLLQDIAKVDRYLEITPESWATEKLHLRAATDEGPLHNPTLAS